MKASDALFFGRLFFVFGLLFIAGGWVSAFTEVGAFLIYSGLLMLVACPCLLVFSMRRR